MREAVPEQFVDMIFQLKLSMRLIQDGKKAYAFIVAGKESKGSYVILMDIDPKSKVEKSKWEIELKGNVDVEYLKYHGEVDIEPVKDQPDYFRMKNVHLFRENSRDYKRVPYRRSIEIVQPEQQEAVLINISASGAMIHTRREIPADNLTFKLILAKKPLLLKADIVEQTYVEDKNLYIVRCHFNPISSRDMKHINNVVKEIILMAKKRLDNEK